MTKQELLTKMMMMEDTPYSELVYNAAVRLFRNTTERPPVDNEDIPIVLKIATTLAYIDRGINMPTLSLRSPITKEELAELVGKVMEGWISFYMYGDEIRVQPTLYKTKEDALRGMQETTCNYNTTHLKFVCEPVYVRIDEQDASK